MKTTLEKLERSVNGDRTAVLVLGIIMLISVLDLTLGIVSLMSRDPSDFTIRSEQLESGMQMTCLYLDGEELGEICPNDYILTDEEGNTNYRAAAVIAHIEEIIDQVIMAAILLLVYCLFRNCKKMRSPFTIKSVWILRWIAILVILMSFLPEAVTAIAYSIVFLHAKFDVSIANFYLALLGGAFGMIAEIFKYGAALQEDSDSIA